MTTLQNILVATDFGEAADTALTYGRTLAERFGATLHVLHVIQTPPMMMVGPETIAWSPSVPREAKEAARRTLTELTVDTDRSGPPTHTAIVESGSPAMAIIDYASNHRIDLIVIGTHGRGGLAHVLMGSVAERVVRLAPCPVLTVKHPEHEFVRPDTLAVVARA